MEKKGISKQQIKLVEAAMEIQQESPADIEKAFMARQLVQVTLPHRQPKGNPPFWKRTSGKTSLVIRPGFDYDKGEQLPYPFGTIPRLLLIWITTEAKRTNSPRLELGNNLSSFMRELGLDPARGGKRSDAKRLRLQIESLLRSTITFETSTGNDTKGSKSWRDMQVAPDGDMWWNLDEPSQESLWGSYIELGAQFFDAITAAPVPLNMKALRALKGSPMALDLYTWAAYRTFTLMAGKEKEVFVPWRALMKQVGGEYNDLKNFKRKALAALRKVMLVYPNFDYEQVDGGIIVKAGKLAVVHKKAATFAAPKSGRIIQTPTDCENSFKLQEATLIEAKKLAPKADLNAAIKDWKEWKKEPPRYPDKAFLKFVATWYKNRLDNMG